jgi:hypothetical protein
VWADAGPSRRLARWQNWFIASLHTFACPSAGLKIQPAGGRLFLLEHVRDAAPELILRERWCASRLLCLLKTPFLLRALMLEPTLDTLLGDQVSAPVCGELPVVPQRRLNGTRHYGDPARAKIRIHV